MARKRRTKIGIDYFSHDTDLFYDDKVEFLFAEHGLIGYAIYLRLLEVIYRSTGYYIKPDDTIDAVFARNNRIDLNKYIEIRKYCIELGLFDKKMYEKRRILTSPRIQENYLEATVRRKDIKLIKEYVLIGLDEYQNITLAKLKDIEDPPDEEEETQLVEVPKVKCVEVINYLNTVLGTRYTVTENTRKAINARIKEIKDLKLDDFKLVIHTKYNEWGSNPEMSKFLRPDTLFGTKFQSYLNTPIVSNGKSQTSMQALDKILKEAEDEENGNNTFVEDA
jgi:uncharacterized phage protein (TIGR02220 family)